MLDHKVRLVITMLTGFCVNDIISFAKSLHKDRKIKLYNRQIFVKNYLQYWSKFVCAILLPNSMPFFQSSQAPALSLL